MNTRVKRVLSWVSWMLLPVVALAVPMEFSSSNGKTLQAYVSGWVTSGNVAVPVSVSNPLPVAAGQAAYVATPLLVSSVGASSVTIAAAGVAAHTLTVCTGPSQAGNLWMNPSGGTAVSGSGVVAAAYGGCFTFSPAPTTAVTGISDTGTININGAGS